MRQRPTIFSYNSFISNIAFILVLVTPLYQCSPLTFIIPHGDSVCIYEKLEGGEFLTFSVLINGGNELRCTVSLEGPVAPADEDSSTEINLSLRKYGQGQKFGSINQSKRERGFDRSGNFYAREYINSEADYSVYDDYNYNRDKDKRNRKRNQSADIKNRNRDKDKHSQKPNKSSEIKKESKSKSKNKGQGDPWLKTVQILAPGWYKGCVFGNRHQISAEMDLRKSSEYGLSHETFHVLTTMEHRLLFLSDQPEDEDAAKEEHLENARQKIMSTAHTIHQIQEKQRESMSKLEIHMLINDHSRSRIVMSSIIESGFLLFLTLTQAYLIRRWFEANSLLGI